MLSGNLVLATNHPSPAPDCWKSAAQAAIVKRRHIIMCPFISFRPTQSHSGATFFRRCLAPVNRPQSLQPRCCQVLRRWGIIALYQHMALGRMALQDASPPSAGMRTGRAFHGGSVPGSCLIFQATLQLLQTGQRCSEIKPEARGRHNSKKLAARFGGVSGTTNSHPYLSRF